MKKIETIAILGGGLLGGSLAMALQDRHEVRLWARRSESAAEARELGISGASTDLRSAIAGADLVVLSVPVGAMRSLVEAALENGLSEASLVTDVGSVKRVVHREAGALLKASGISFIGSHPMAGSEQKGVSAARSDLFSGAMCFLTNDDHVSHRWAEMLAEFWKDLGCRVCWRSAGAHDELVARISHFPHLIAAAAARVSLREPSEARFGGGGLRDTTRVAGGDPDMWAEILMENRVAVAESVAESIGVLQDVQASLISGDHRAIREWLVEANSLHKSSRTFDHSSDIVS